MGAGGVTPLLTEDQMILVEVKPEVNSSSEREYYLAGQRYTDPQVKTRLAETTARLKSGETLVIGGLIRSEGYRKYYSYSHPGGNSSHRELFVLHNKTHEGDRAHNFLSLLISLNIKEGIT